MTEQPAAPIRIAGIRYDGHRVITIMTGRAGSLNLERQHDPDCPHHAAPTPAPTPADHRSARIARRRKPTHRPSEETVMKKTPTGATSNPTDRGTRCPDPDTHHAADD